MVSTILSLFPRLSPCLSTRPQVPRETVGAILCAANRAVFLVPVPISSHRGTKRKGVLKETGLWVRLCACVKERETHAYNEKHSSSSLVVTLDHTQLRQVQSHVWPDVIKKKKKKISNLNLTSVLRLSKVEIHIFRNVPKIISAKKNLFTRFSTENLFLTVVFH